MSTMKSSTSLMATLIGDLVRSRVSGDRAALHQRLVEVLAEANARLLPVVPLRITAGDEYQGGFASVGAALHASWWLRLGLLPDDIRHGIGWGGGSVPAQG